MVAIAPFRALRYNLDVVGNLSLVVAPPYDVISPEEQDQLYEASPYNIVRLILGKQAPTDRPTDNRYTRARQTFDHWRDRQILIRDETPAIYLYEQTFAWEGTSLRRLGFVALLQFQDSVPGQVFLHEATIEGPKADRTRLLEAVRANFSPLFCIVPDPSQQIQTLLNQVSRELPPLASVHVGSEEARFWAITEPATIMQLQRAVEGMSVLIADGHHRFEVALSRRHLFGAVMSYFSWLDDPALLVRPIHRVVQHEETPPLQLLRAVCLVEQASDLESVMQWLQGEDAQGRFGYYDGRTFFRVMVHADQLAQWLMAPSVPLPIAALDVSLLHGFLLPRLGRACGFVGETIGYTAEPAEALRVVTSGKGRSAWLLRPIPLAQIFALASQGLTLPAKSTYFYPKILSGLFINPFD